MEHLLDRYGTLAADVLDLTRADPGLAQPLADGHPYLRAEVAYAVVAEDALHVEDVLMRRMRLFIESADSGTGVAAEVSSIMGAAAGLEPAQARRGDPALCGAGRGRADPGRACRRPAAEPGAGRAPGRPARGWPAAGAGRGCRGMSMNDRQEPAADVPA